MRLLGIAAVCAAAVAWSVQADAAAQIDTIYSFKQTDGDTPQFGLVEDASGALYGTTSYGGPKGEAACPQIGSPNGLGFRPAGCGVVFKLTPPAKGKTAWTETVLHAFRGGVGGSYPLSDQLLDKAGNLYGIASAGGGGGAYCPGRSDGTGKGCGLVYELIPPAAGKTAWTETVLFSFGGTNGAAPAGTLIADAAGNLYGVTREGGKTAACAPIGATVDPGCGVVFKLTRPAAGRTVWTETVLHEFSAGADGTHPVAGLVMDKAGNLYGTTIYGGASAAKCPADPDNTIAAGCGVAFRLSPPAKAGGAWTETVIRQFEGKPFPASPQGTLVFGKDGSLYGTSLSGGTGVSTPQLAPSHAGVGTVFKLSPVAGQKAWTEQVLHSFGGNSDGIGPFAGAIFDSAGNLFGTTYLSTPGAGVVYELRPPAAGKTAWSEKVIYKFTGAQGIVPLGDLLLDKAGTLFGTTDESFSTNGRGTVFELTP